MQERDGCLVLMDQRLEGIQREGGAGNNGGVMRWNEQVQVAEFHMKMAARCWIPTKVSTVDIMFSVV